MTVAEEWTDWERSGYLKLPQLIQDKSSYMPLDLSLALMKLCQRTHKD